MRAAVVLALAASVLPSCTYLTGDNSILVSSVPQGAAILVDDQDTGLTTPAMVELGGFNADDHWITIKKTGFGPEKRRVKHYTTTYTSRWVDGAVAEGLPSFPLFWTFGDMMLPFAVRWRYVPHEVYVRLYKPGEGPVSSEATNPGEPAVSGTR